MNFSGVLILCAPEHLEAIAETVAAHPWAEIHYSEESGRMVATIEAEDTTESMERLGQIQKLPHVTLAEMVEYQCEDETRPDFDLSGERSAAKLHEPEVKRRGRTG